MAPPWVVQPAPGCTVAPLPGTQLPSRGLPSPYLRDSLASYVGSPHSGNVCLPLPQFISSFSPSVSMVFLRTVHESKFFDTSHDWWRWESLFCFSDWSIDSRVGKDFPSVLKAFLPCPQASGLLSRVPNPFWLLFHSLWLSGWSLHPDRAEISQARILVGGSFHRAVTFNLATRGIFFKYFLGNFLSPLCRSPLSLECLLFRSLASWLVSLIFRSSCQISHIFVFLLYFLDTSLHFLFQTFCVFFTSAFMFLILKSSFVECPF